MKRFYTRLAEGETKDVALQQAKLDFLSHANQLKSHPFYWSSFLITGNSAPLLDNPPSAPLVSLTFFILLLLLVLVIMMRYRGKKERKRNLFQQVLLRLLILSPSHFTITQTAESLFVFQFL